MSEGAIRFAEKTLALLDDGRFSSTYKYAVLLGLLDLSLESIGASGEPANSFNTRKLAEKVIELYWPHAVPFACGSKAGILIQNGSGRQVEILTAIRRTRDRIAEAVPSASLTQVRQRAPEQITRLTDQVERLLIDMPLPRLQRAGKSEEQFIYDWKNRASRPNVAIRSVVLWKLVFAKASEAIWSSLTLSSGLSSNATEARWSPN